MTVKFIIPATHDTASAVAAVPATTDNFLYISSGTWSLMGTETKKADCSEESQKLNFTNEGGYEYRFKILKEDIMGAMDDSVCKKRNRKRIFLLHSSVKWLKERVLVP